MDLRAEAELGERATQARGDVTTRIRERSYRVVGSDAQTLRRCVELLGPPIEGREGRGCAAYTRWQVRWSYQAREARDGHGAFRPEDVRIACDATMTLPHWDAPPGAPVALVTLWQEVLVELRAHEEGHVRIGIETAHDVLRAITATPAAPSEAALRAEVAGRIDAAIASRREAERRYDATAALGRDARSALGRLAARR
ncbi:MAG: DUF922 domain-containing protein [Polyangiaceae bacterium]|nr:DUF922 domain-containing protein [Polyangiaceae bacterium]